MEFKLLKTFRSHAAFSRFLMEVDYAPVGYIPRVQSIPSPYAYSPTDFIYNWKGTRIIVRETAHRVYKAFEVPADITVHNNEEDAIQAYLVRDTASPSFIL